MEKHGQFVRKEVVPYINHFGILGISPRIVNVKREDAVYYVVEYEHVEGPRLNNLLLVEETEVEKLMKTYKKLGENVALVSKTGVNHGDLIPDNIIISKKDKPMIIDWDKSIFYPVFPFTSKKENADSHLKANSELLEHTEKYLIECGREEIYPKLQKTFSREFKREFEDILTSNINHYNIQQSARKRFGIL